MMKQLFGQPYDTSDANWPIKGYFDIVYDDGVFIEAVGYILRKWGFHIDGADCSFPDMNSPFEEERFDGVGFSYGYSPERRNSAVVSNETCLSYVKLACDKYLDRHPEDRKKIADLLSKNHFEH